MQKPNLLLFAGKVKVSKGRLFGRECITAGCTGCSLTAAQWPAFTRRAIWQQISRDVLSWPFPANVWDVQFYKGLVWNVTFHVNERQVRPEACFVLISTCDYHHSSSLQVNPMALEFALETICKIKMSSWSRNRSNSTSCFWWCYSYLPLVFSWVQWWPNFAVDQCKRCLVATKDQQTEHIQPKTNWFNWTWSSKKEPVCKVRFTFSEIHRSALEEGTGGGEATSPACTVDNSCASSGKFDKFCAFIVLVLTAWLRKGSRMNGRLRQGNFISALRSTGVPGMGRHSWANLCNLITRGKNVTIVYHSRELFCLSDIFAAQDKLESASQIRCLCLLPPTWCHLLSAVQQHFFNETSSRKFQIAFHFSLTQQLITSWKLKLVPSGQVVWSDDCAEKLLEVLTRCFNVCPRALCGSCWCVGFRCLFPDEEQVLGKSRRFCVQSVVLILPVDPEF